MEFHLKMIGILLIILGLIHSVFPRYFNWKDELAGISLINRQMMSVHTFFIALTLVLMGLLCLISSQDLISTDLGKTVSLGFGIFWTVRLIFQFFVYSPALWKGKKFETTVHIVFALLWTYLSVMFIYNAVR